MTTFYKRSGETYFTPAQVSVFLGEYLLDEACLIQYDVMDRREPLWGYNDVQFRNIAVGQTIVRGRLGIRYRYEGYLMRVLQESHNREARMPTDPSEIAGMKRGSGLGLSDEVLQSSADAVLDYLDASAEAGNGDYLRASDFLKSRFWDYPGDLNDVRAHPNWARVMMGDVSHEDQAEREERTHTAGYHRPWLVTPVDIRVMHGPDANVTKPAFNRLIKNVVFDQQSYIADIDVPGGERVCTEMYTFIARNVVPVRIPKQRPS